MENLRRKEHDTSATICTVSGFTMRTKLHRPLLVEEVACLGRLLDQLKNIFDLHRLTLIAAPPDRWE
jgi:hypothetical protein